ncbi:hypothetical protein [Mastigocoleus sp. MO_188.B34]|uniref:hypothetical protein n=1 Tax=Mastigocoleus sp. MO_188.B34 TaxID=3036635 RepID=UPI002626CD9B|nr:hypothetical protein [Mastigocoleus sp. MO_188.B34]
MHNIQIKKIETQDETKIVNLDEAEKITGSGLFSWGGTLSGFLVGGGGGTLYYPASEGFKKITTGESDFNLVDWGSTISGSAAAGATAGAGLGKFVDGAIFGDRH